MNNFQIHGMGLAELLRVLGDECPQITWGGASYRCIPSSVAMRYNLSVGGHSVDYDLTTHILIADWLTSSIQTADALKSAMITTRVVYLNEAYRVHEVQILSGAFVAMLGLNALGQDA